MRLGYIPVTSLHAAAEAHQLLTPAETLMGLAKWPASNGFKRLA